MVRLLRNEYHRASGGMADTKDLKSFDRKRSCGFDSHLAHVLGIFSVIFILEKKSLFSPLFPL